MYLRSLRQYKRCLIHIWVHFNVGIVAQFHSILRGALLVKEIAARADYGAHLLQSTILRQCFMHQRWPGAMSHTARAPRSLGVFEPTNHTRPATYFAKKASATGNRQKRGVSQQSHAKRPSISAQLAPPATAMSDRGENEPLLDGSPAVTEHKPVPRGIFWRVILLSYFMLFCSQLYGSSFNTFIYQTLEGLLCRDMYDDVGDPLKDPRCKGEAVQSELSLLTSMEATFEVIPPMICGIIYGLMADVYGRKPVLVLATFGALLYGSLDVAVCWFHDYVPIKLFWAVPVIYFFTGGALVAATINYTLVTDVLTKSQRSALFMALGSALLLGAFVSAYLAELIAPLGDYPAMGVALLVQVAGLVAALAMPETLHLREEQPEAADDSVAFRKKLSARLAEFRTKSLSSLREMFWGGNTKLTLLLMSTLFTGVGKHVVASVMKQYAVKRYELSWVEAGIILSWGNLVRMIICFIVVPLLTVFLRRAKILPITQDAWLSRFSVIAAITCSCLAGAAPNISAFTASVVVYAFSSCLEPTVRSLVVLMARDAGTGSVISAMEVLIAVSIAIAGPIIAATFRLGMSLGGGWIGLPMYVGGAIMVPGALMLLFLRFDEEVAEELEEENEGLL
ncbi:hypothetical protein PWT90_08476 [Aphanocladium album]|nr:hypothetical protein PWT90_08476 [Aphanocladium album]